ncbi:MAG: hypothetical protein EHM53_02120 [Methanoregulaceae archaeon]|nr:MAG: hypothetical protein EHM53_02120 [Methanoregulaceae archaeon]
MGVSLLSKTYFPLSAIMNNHGDDKPLQEPGLTKEARNTQFLMVSPAGPVISEIQKQFIRRIILTFRWTPEWPVPENFLFKNGDNYPIGTALPVA